MICKCPSCGGAIRYTEEDTGRVEACPHCSARLTLPTSGVNAATRQTVRRGVLWTLAKMIGLLILIASFLWFLLLVSAILMNNATARAWAVAAYASMPAVFGMILGTIIFLIARKGGIGFVCSNCGKAIGKNAAVCTACGSAF